MLPGLFQGQILSVVKFVMSAPRSSFKYLYYTWPGRAMKNWRVPGKKKKHVMWSQSWVLEFCGIKLKIYPSPLNLSNKIIHRKYLVYRREGLENTRWTYIYSIYMLIGILTAYWKTLSDRVPCILCILFHFIAKWTPRGRDYYVYSADKEDYKILPTLPTSKSGLAMECYNL